MENKYDLSYMDNGTQVTARYNEGDLREWLDAWPDYVNPVEVRIMKVTESVRSPIIELEPDAPHPPVEVKDVEALQRQ